MAEKAVGRHPEDSIESAVDDVRAGSAAVRASCPHIGPRHAGKIALVNWAKKVGKLQPAEYVCRFPWTTSGAEHSVFHDEAGKLAIKATRPNRFGHSPSGPGYESTPIEYLLRLYWQNALFGDDVRILAVTLDDEEHIQVVHSQPWIYANKADPTVLTKEEIDEYFARFGFYPATINPDAPLYYSPELGLIVADAHEQNVLRDLDGNILPIDVVIGAPAPEFLAEILRAYDPAGHRNN